MRTARVFVILGVALGLAAFAYGFQGKRKPPKPPDITLLEVVCRRVEGEVNIDGKLRATGLKQFRNVELLIDFLGTGKQLLQTKRGPIDAEALDPDQEAEFHLRVADPIRAVYFSVRAEDGDGRDLRLDREGPFPIE